MNEKLLNQIYIDLRESKEKEENRKLANKNTSPDCFVITATMGDPNHPIVNEFRRYRDVKLLRNNFGKAFVKFYYLFAPYVSIEIRKSLFLRKLTFLIFVNPIYKRLSK